MGSALIIAHPGHELLLHHWMELSRPTVFALTDGSGRSGEDRTDRSRHVIDAAGAIVGRTFGIATDRAWYQAILNGDRALFDQAHDVILDSCQELGVSSIVTDAIEFFSPMHDLCNALVCAIARSIEATGRHVKVLDYANERADLKTDIADISIMVERQALSRKHDAVHGYRQLTAEVERRQARFAELAVERLYPVDISNDWPDEPPEVPFYEEYGRDRIAEGQYSQLITYSDNVRPLAAALRAI